MFIGHFGLAFAAKRIAVANQLSTPPGEQAVAWGTLSMWLLVLWMSWIDRLRQSAEAVGERSASEGARS